MRSVRFPPPPLYPSLPFSLPLSPFPSLPCFCLSLYIYHLRTCKGDHPERIITRAYPTCLRPCRVQNCEETKLLLFKPLQLWYFIRHPVLNKIYGDPNILKFPRGHIWRSGPSLMPWLIPEQNRSGFRSTYCQDTIWQNSFVWSTALAYACQLANVE